MVSKKGFTKQALKLAKHEYIGCISLLPADPRQASFSIGSMWYGVLQKWTDCRLILHFPSPGPSVAPFNSESVKWGGMPVVNWFLKELFTTYAHIQREGEHVLHIAFDEVRPLEVEGKQYPVSGVSVAAIRVCKKKRKWVSWSGDAFYDWHELKVVIPPKGTIVGSAVANDLSIWDDYDGDIPDIETLKATDSATFVIYDTQQWDESKQVPDLTTLGRISMSPP
jgi:hypothetical protein